MQHTWFLKPTTTPRETLAKDTITGAGRAGTILQNNSGTKKSTSWDPGARLGVVMVRKYLGPCVPSSQALPSQGGLTQIPSSTLC